MKDYYVNLLKECFNKFRPLISTAPIRRGFNRTFGMSIPSQRDVMMQRDNAIKDIINEATCMGIDVGIALKEEKPYESPFVEPKGD